MLASLTQLLNHYAHRVSVTMQAHPKGTQLTITVLPCPNKIKDEALRQQLISPIVIAGDNESLLTQLRQLDDSLTTAQANPAVEKGVSEYLGQLKKASGKKAVPTPKAASNVTEEKTQTDTSTKQTQPSQATSALDAMFI